MTISTFKELIVWQKSVDLAREIYASTEHLPQKEQFGLQSQMRRCAVSIASNIAEGKKRGTRKDFVQFLRIADGSAAELETQITIASAVYPHNADFARSADMLLEVQRMLGGMIKKLNS